MDLLDLLKVVIRRWYAAVPVVLVTVVGALMLGGSIQPEYNTEAAVVLVPPTTQPAEPAAGASPQPGNPWLRVGETSMAQAVQISVQNGDARRRVAAAAGGNATYEVGLVTRSSILTIEVNAATRQAASATVKAVIGLIQAEVASRQQEYKPKPGEEITTQVLDPGDNVAASRSNVLRAQIVAIALGMLLAAVCAVGVDAISRHRAGRTGRSGRRLGIHLGRATAAGQAIATGQASVGVSVEPWVGTGEPNNGSRTPVSADYRPAPDDTVLTPRVVDDGARAPRSDDTIMLSAVPASDDEGGSGHDQATSRRSRRKSGRH